MKNYLSVIWMGISQPKLMDCLKRLGYDIK